MTESINKTQLHAEIKEGGLTICRLGDSQPVLVQQAAPGKRPFIHPITSPDGCGIVTEDAPAHHPWQHGLYTGFNDVNGIGFWKESKPHQPDPKEGIFQPKRLNLVRADGNEVEWIVETDWCTRSSDHLLTEEQHWTFHDMGMTYILDLKWVLTAATDLTFGHYAYGGLYLRMPYRDETGGRVCNSEGIEQLQTDGMRARWTALSMNIEQRKTPAGMAVMDHPDNAGYPQPWRVDKKLGISPSPSALGDWTLACGQSRTFRHRVYVFTGEIDRVAVERIWEQFSYRSVNP